MCEFDVIALSTLVLIIAMGSPFKFVLLVTHFFILNKLHKVAGYSFPLSYGLCYNLIILHNLSSRSIYSSACQTLAL